MRRKSNVSGVSPLELTPDSDDDDDDDDDDDEDGEHDDYDEDDEDDDRMTRRKSRPTLALLLPALCLAEFSLVHAILAQAKPKAGPRQ